MIGPLSYESILAEIRRHKNDPLIGKGKFSWEERLADHLLCLLNQNKSILVPGSQTYIPPTTLVPTPLHSPGSLAQVVREALDSQES